MSNLIENANQKSGTNNPFNCVTEFFAGSDDILNIETNNGRIKHIYFCRDHHPDHNHHTRASPIKLPTPHNVCLVVRGSKEINTKAITDLIAEFAKTNPAPLNRPRECANLFCDFLAVTFRKNKSSQTDQLKKLTAAYYSDIFERIEESYREQLKGLKWRPDRPSPFEGPMAAIQEQWINVDVAKPFQGKFGKTSDKYFSHVFDALHVASGDFILTRFDGFLLINMVFGRLCSVAFSPIKSSMFFIGHDAEGNISVARLDTDGVVAGHLKSKVTVLERRDQLPALNLHVRH